ncbi:uncharacterized protein LOC131332077 [Rhododendron vialii]|uniref:uncharacterized protein LOC131332077 n=1 Tax=Rhododendron vialii TaxID=182163 RepID=UPI00265EE8BD|nr:uncharacterized protein LOC131332077 [Rhododendron vialii]
MIEELLRAISPSLSEIRFQQSRQYIQAKTGFQLVEQLSCDFDKKISLEIKRNVITRNQFEEFTKKSLDQTTQILEKISRSKPLKQLENLDYFKDLHSEILKRINKLEEKQLVLSDKLPCKQDIINLTSKLDTTQPKDIETEIRNLVKDLRVEVDRIKQSSVEIRREIDEKLQKMEILLEEVKNFKPTGKTDEVVIKQNNTIIELLISLSHRLADASEKIDQLSTRVDKLQEENALETLTSKINQVSISSSTGHLEPRKSSKSLQNNTFYYNIFGIPDPNKGKKLEIPQSSGTQ